MRLCTFHELKLSAKNALGRLGCRRAALVVALMFCCVVFVIRAHSGLKTEVLHTKTRAARLLALPPVAQGSPRESARAVKFQLFQGGIYPREIHVDKGLLAITIEDYSGGSAGLVVERQLGNALEHVGRVERAGPHWRGKSEVSLTPGRYILHMSDRPANRALLVVEP